MRAPSALAASGAVPASRSSFSPRDALLLVLLALMWGHSFLFIKVAVAAVAPAWIVAARVGIGGAFLLAIVAVRKVALPRELGVWVALALVGLLGSSAGWLAQAWAQAQLDSGLVAVLNATTPAATLLLAVLARQERAHPVRLAGLALAIVGTVIIIGGEIEAGGPPLALVVAVVATVAYGFGTVVARARIAGKVRPLPAAAGQNLIATAVMVVVAFVAAGPAPAPSTLPPAIGLSLLALGVLGTGLAFLVYHTLIERVGATNASLVTYLVPVVGLVSGALFLGERFGVNVLVGAVVLLAGVWLAQRTAAPVLAVTSAEVEVGPTDVAGGEGEGRAPAPPAGARSVD